MSVRVPYAHGAQRGALFRLSGGEFADHCNAGGAQGDQ
jgi:hypothetical protein